jgi:hypothetical protein
LRDYIVFVLITTCLLSLYYFSLKARVLQRRVCLHRDERLRTTEVMNAEILWPKLRSGVAFGAVSAPPTTPLFIGMQR